LAAAGCAGREPHRAGAVSPQLRLRGLYARFSARCGGALSPGARRAAAAVPARGGRPDPTIFLAD
nr:hypothetical protein [Tanacetum cinerariifolium]